MLTGFYQRCSKKPGYIVPNRDIKLNIMPGKKPKRHTFFGITPPVWVEDSPGNGPCTITFLLEGRIISKKNNEMAVVGKKAARNWFAAQKGAKFTPEQAFEAALSHATAVFVGNKEYAACKAKFVPVLQDQMNVWEDRLAAKGVKFPIKKAAMSLRFYFRDKYVTDTVNKQQTVQDLLQDAGVIAGDHYTVLNPITAASAYYGPKVIRDNITVIRLTFKLPKKKRTSITDVLI